MASLAEPLLSRLKSVRPAGTDQWYAHCPAHDDHTPSLSIRETVAGLFPRTLDLCPPEAQ